MRILPNLLLTAASLMTSAGTLATAPPPSVAFATAASSSSLTLPSDAVGEACSSGAIAFDASLGKPLICPPAGSPGGALFRSIQLLLPPVCGNGASGQSNGEECDDGNAEDGDGCSATCTVEDRWACSNDGPTSVCEIVVLPNMGDAVGWWKADAIDAEDLAQVDANGHVVSWTDLTGNANHLVPVHGSDRPSYVASSPDNGMPAVEVETTTRFRGFNFGGSTVPVNEFFLAFKCSAFNDDGNMLREFPVSVQGSINGANELNTMHVDFVNIPSLQASFKIDFDTPRWMVYHGVTKSQVNLNNLFDGTQCEFGELIAYDTPLPEADATAVRKYMMSRWHDSDPVTFQFHAKNPTTGPLLPTSDTDDFEDYYFVTFSHIVGTVDGELLDNDSQIVVEVDGVAVGAFVTFNNHPTYRANLYRVRLDIEPDSFIEGTEIEFNIPADTVYRYKDVVQPLAENVVSVYQTESPLVTFTSSYPVVENAATATPGTLTVTATFTRAVVKTSDATSLDTTDFVVTAVSSSATPSIDSVVDNADATFTIEIAFDSAVAHGDVFQIDVAPGDTITAEDDGIQPTPSAPELVVALETAVVLDGISSWYDATTIRDDSTEFVTGGRVNKWVDLSGQGNHLVPVQTSSTRWPTHVATSPDNGNAAVSLTSTDRSWGFDLDGYRPKMHEFFIALKCTVFNDAGSLFREIAVDQEGNINSANELDHMFLDDVEVPSLMASIKLDFDTPRWVVYHGVTKYAIDNSYWFDGTQCEIGEFMFYETPVSEAEADTMRQYLMNKWHDTDPVTYKITATAPDGVELSDNVDVSVSNGDYFFITFSHIVGLADGSDVHNDDDVSVQIGGVDYPKLHVTFNNHPTYRLNLYRIRLDFATRPPVVNDQIDFTIPPNHIFRNGLAVTPDAAVTATITAV